MGFLLFDSVDANIVDILNTYRNLIQAIPMIIWSFFVGSFLDNFKGGMRFLLVMGNAVEMIVVLYLLANVYFYVELSKQDLSVYLNYYSKSLKMAFVFKVLIIS